MVSESSQGVTKEEAYSRLLVQGQGPLRDGLRILEVRIIELETYIS